MKIHRIYYVAILMIAMLGSCKSKEKQAVDQQFVIGQTNMANKDYNGAINAFYKAIKINPKNYEAFHQIGLCYMFMNKKEKGNNNLKMAKTMMEKNEDLTKQEVKEKYDVIYKDYNDFKTGVRKPGDPDGAPVQTPTGPTPGNQTPIDTAGPR